MKKIKKKISDSSDLAVRTHVLAVRTQKEVDAVVDKCISGDRFPGMTYEEGVRNALDWLTGEIDDSPFE